MRIKTLQIDSYGKFSDKRLYLPNDSKFIVIHGPNEAGKSTLMSFIKAMLFGIPSRNELLAFGGNKPQSLFRGNLTFISDHYGETTIERSLSDKNQVKAYSSQSPLMDGALVQEILKGLDRRLFEAIFCFDLNGLQGLEKMKEDELNHYLFSTGMMGNAKINQLEKRLAKSQGDLFKPNGKNPEINRTLHQLESLEQEKKNLVKKDHEYQMKFEELQKTIGEFADVEQLISKTIEKQKELHVYKALKPLVLEEEQLNKRLQYLDDETFFPEDGVLRLENYQRQLLDYEGEAVKVKEKLDYINGEINKIEIHFSLIDKTPLIENFIKQASSFEQTRSELSSLKERDQAIQYQLKDQLATLGEGWSLKAIEKMDTGISVKENLRNLLKEVEDREQDLKTSTQELLISKQRLSSLQQQIETARSRVLSSNDRNHIEDQLKKGNEKVYLETQKETYHQQLTQHERQIAQSKKLSNIMGLVGLIFGSLVGILTGFWQGFLFGGILTSIIWIMSFLGFSFIRRMNTTNQKAVIEKKLAEINQILSQLTSIDSDKLQYTLQEDRRAQIAVEMYQQQHQNEVDRFKLIEQRAAQHNQKMDHAEKKWTEWFNQAKFPIKVSEQIILDVFQVIIDIKENIKEHQRLVDKMSTMEKELSKQQLNIEELLESVGLDKRLTIIQIEEKLRTEQQKVSRKEKLSEQLLEIRERLDILQEKIDRVKAERNQLFKRANASDEEEFRTKFNQDKEKQAFLARRSVIIDKQRLILSNDAKRAEFIEKIHQGILDEIISDDIDCELQSYREKQQKLQQNISDLKSEMKHMEENVSLSQHLHQLENERSILNQQVRRWSVYRTAAEILRMAKERYRKERLPLLLQKAIDYFSVITQGSYLDIFYQENEGFLVKNNKGMLFKVIELSRGTQEQLYLSLRLALASLYDTEIKLPLIIDDSFVNFDEERLYQTTELLQAISYERQVLFFTGRMPMKITPSAYHIPLTEERKMVNE